MSIPSRKIKLPKSAGNQEGAWTFVHRPGGWVIAERKLADGSVERTRLVVSEARGQIGMSVHGKLWQGELDLGRESAKGGAADLEAAFSAQFPGKVRKVLVKPGQLVAEGEKLLLVEAMKMEFAIQAPVAGTVVAVLVTEGKQVSPGDKFIQFEKQETKK